MSKRLRNYPPPTDVLEENGADALRLYLVDSPAVRAENLRFDEKGVKVRLFLPSFSHFSIAIYTFFLTPRALSARSSCPGSMRTGSLSRTPSASRYNCLPSC
jgi:leucyl-tRNA synthetase